ncbi:MAG: hypothetical protein IPN59_09410 [Holophaga sp.]|nr:hypothetical protein [Holophaga sp.]
MPWSLSRKRVLFLALGVCVMGLAVGAYVKLRREVGRALNGPLQASAPLQMVPLIRIDHPVERWGGGDVGGVALTSGALVTAGGFGVVDEKGDRGSSLPTLRVSALVSWREHAVVGLASGGLFLYREGQWEELRSGFGTLHVRALQESAGGELWIGAREGLYRTTWGATTLDRVDNAPVKSVALGEAGTVFAGGEEGLRRVEGLHARLWPRRILRIIRMGVSGQDLLVITPLGLLKGSLDGATFTHPRCRGSQ